MLKKFGIEVLFLDDLTLTIKGNQKYIATDYKVEGEFFSVRFFLLYLEL